MGWNSWNVFGADISDEKIRKMADAMVDLGLTNYGYAYINIDDGWQDSVVVNIMRLCQMKNFRI